MPNYEIDFTGVESYSMLGVGTHAVIITKAEYKQAQTGTPMLVVTYKDANGNAAFDNFTLVPQSLWKLKLFLETVFGAVINGKINLDPATLINRSLVIKVAEEPYIDDMGKAGSRMRVLPEYTVAQVGAIVNTPVPPQAALFQNPGMPTPPVQNIQQPIVTPTPPVTPGVVPATVPPTIVAPQNNAPVVDRPKLPWEK